MENHNNMKKSNYKKFGLMMLVSFVMMYAIMFLNVFEVIPLTRISKQPFCLCACFFGH